MGVIDDLVRRRQPAGAERRGDAAHSVDRDDAPDAAFSQGPEVRPVIDPVRRDGVAFAVARQKD